MSDGLDRLKVLINSSTPIVVMETSEEMRAVSVVRAACSELNMATFEWSIADGLVRTEAISHPAPMVSRGGQSAAWAQASRVPAQGRTALSPGGGEAERLARALMSSV